MAQTEEERKEKARVRAKEWYWANRERAIAASGGYYRRNKVEQYAKSRARITKSPEAHLAYKSYLIEYARTNSAKAVARVAEWRKKNPDKVKLQNAKRKAQKLGSMCGPIDYEAIKAKGMWCGICDFVIEGAYQYDHIIPLAAGGTHTQDNLQLAHPICNWRKKSKVDYVPPAVLKKTPQGLQIGVG